jgi:hypothetical protein
MLKKFREFIYVLLLSMVVFSPVVYSQQSNEIANWFRSLKTPVQLNDLPAGISCCSEADCKQREVWLAPNGVRWAWIEEANSAHPIPEEAKITDPDVLVRNPFFQMIVCYIPIRGIICFVEGNSGG